MTVKEKEGIIVLILGIVLVFSSAIYPHVNAQTPLSKFEDKKLGLTFQYPSLWEEAHVPDAGCLSVDTCEIIFTVRDPKPLEDLSELKNVQIYLFGAKVTKLNSSSPSQEACNCNNLKDYVAWEYNKGNKDQVTFIDDNQTMIGSNYTAWQLQWEATAQPPLGLSMGNYEVLAINGGFGYKFTYLGNTEPQFGKYLDGFKQLLSSVKLIQPEPEKKPSFLTSAENNTSKSLTTGVNDNTVKILSSNNFIDSIGVLHVVGEVQNNLGQSIKFVKVIGTFYNTNNQVVATDFTYTNPADIPLAGKAPFDLSLSSASIPVQSIDHYRIVTEYQ